MRTINPISIYKNNIAAEVLSSDNIIKALVINEEDFLKKPLPQNFKSRNLLYQQVFPYAYVPNIETKARTYITMSFGDFRYINNVFKSGIVTFFIFTHISLVPTMYGLRYDYISHQIDKIFNKNYGVGAFTLEINSSGDLNVSESYFGSTLSYKFTSFQ